MIIYSITIILSHSLFSAIFFIVLCFLSVISLFDIDPGHGSEVLSRLPKHKKFVMCLMEKTHVFNKLCSGVSYTAVPVLSVLRNQQYGTSRKRKKKIP